MLRVGVTKKDIPIADNQHRQQFVESCRDFAKRVVFKPAPDKDDHLLQ
jgi:hypothetical protein